MRRELLVIAVSCMSAVSIMAWIIWSARPVQVSPSVVVPSTLTSGQDTAAVPVFDEERAADLRIRAENNSKDVESRVALGKLYFDAHRFDQAIPWYEQALAVAPNDVDVSTDLGVSYYYMQQPGRAVAQFERSLEVDPMHAKTYLNLGIVRAFGLQDLNGALTAWERVIEIAPDSVEAIAAQDALDRIGSVHGSETNGATVSGQS